MMLGGGTLAEPSGASAIAAGMLPDITCVRGQKRVHFGFTRQGLI